ncbi:hypothetical protein ACC718_39550, partial [Rhizobium ruizarguesonis]
VAIGQHNIAGCVGKALKVFPTMDVGQLKLIDLSLCQVVADMQPPCRAVSARMADRYYARPRDLRQVIDAGEDFIVR